MSNAVDAAATASVNSVSFPPPASATSSSSLLPRPIVEKLRDRGTLTRDDFTSGPISLDEIETGLFLGNLAAATHMETLKAHQIRHILTLDSVPLPKHIVEAPFLTTKYVHISDLPKEDILQHLDACVHFIEAALDEQQNVLVHCYFGVSRSSSVVIAFLMKRHQLDYEAAHKVAKQRRHLVQPNAGFVSQLRLYHLMGCRIDVHCHKYKVYRLRLAGDQVRKVKILPQCFANLIRSDPAITQENPEPIVYRCRRCRRVLATRSHLLLHKSKSKGVVTVGPTIVETTATHHLAVVDADADADDDDDNNICRSILFVEPLAWMKHVATNTQGRLLCPKCEQKLGNFSWINGCPCPCGEEVSPAFYLIPSKVELSTAVQNVQTTV